MKARMFTLALLSVGSILTLLVATGQATKAETMQRVFSIPPPDYRTNTVLESISLRNTTTIAFTPVFTMYLPMIVKNYPWSVCLWLSQQQDSTTGLVADQQDDHGSTYANALAVMAFTLKCDPARAKRILDYFNSRASEFFNNNGCTDFLSCSVSAYCDNSTPRPCGFFQSRNPKTGTPYPSDHWVADMAWLFMAIHHYQAKTNDPSYAQMATAIVNLFELFQQPEGCVARGWDKYGQFQTAIYAEGNLNVYKALSLYKSPAASQVQWCLDYHNFGQGQWEKYPLDLHFWRVLSLGKGYGYALPDTERTDDPAMRYKSTITYNNSPATGFLPSPYGSYSDTCKMENIWAEGTGAMALAFYKAGYKERGDFYVSQLDRLLFEPQGYTGTQALAYYALNSPCDAWVDPTKGHVAPTAWYIFAKEHYDPFDDVVMNSFQIGNPIVQIEAENYVTRSVGVDLVSPGNEFEGIAIHIGGTDSFPGNNSGWAEYKFNVLTPITITAVKIRYADGVAGDAVAIFLDRNPTPIASFDTTKTTDHVPWDEYAEENIATGSIQIQPDLHTLRLQVTDNGTYGVTVDWFQMLIP